MPALNFEKIRLRLRASEKRNTKENGGECVGDDGSETYCTDNKDEDDGTEWALLILVKMRTYTNLIMKIENWIMLSTSWTGWEWQKI